MVDRPKKGEGRGMASLGRSLAVPSVQALAASIDGQSDIPDRYIRTAAESEPVGCTENDELPVISLDLLLDPEHCEDEGAKLDHACQEWGFFQLVDHGLPAELLQRVKEDAAGFFKLPPEEKEAVAQSPDGIEGYGQIFVFSENQKLDWADMLTLFTRPQATRNMRFWSTSPTSFRDTFDGYSLAMNEVANSLLRSMSKNLGLDPESLIETFKEQLQAMRFNYYPPCPQASKVLGHSPHSDATLLTILLQVNDVAGLQIKKNGRWFTIEPLPDAFIVNIGDQLEIFTNGKYKSIEHRVVANVEKERLSVATFHSSGDNIIIGPLPELLNGEDEKYKSMNRDDYLKSYFAAKLDGKSHLERMKIKD